MPRASSPSRALGLLVTAAIAVQGPALANAAAAGAAPAAGTPPASGSAGSAGSAGTATTTTSRQTDTGVKPPEAGQPPPPATASPEAAAADPAATGAPGTTNQPLVAPPNNVTPNSPTTSAGMGGRAIAADDPEAKRAKADLEGVALSDDKAALAEVPSRLPPLQRGAWWAMFGAFALASAGGVFGGLAEVQEDKAERLAITLDTNTGSQLRYEDIQGEYEDVLRVGRRDAAVAKGLLAAGAGFLIGGVVLFIVHAVRARKAAPKSPALLPRDSASARPRASVGAARGGFEVRF